MKVLSSEGLTKLIQLVKSSFISVDDVTTTTEVDIVPTTEVTLATVATSGSYNDLSNKPTIPTVPTNVSAFTNDSGYITSSALSGYATKNYVDTSKADIDLSNITSIGKNIANWSTNVSNCITEIPQDIKLELNNGTVTLKAGSKVYVPNGVGVFDVVTVPSDVVFHSGTVGTGTGNFMLCCNLTGGYGVRADPSIFDSGTTTPTNTNHIWYDTTNNMIKIYENGSWVQKYSLPIGIYVRTNGVATSIDQVFNGFGYIGSTIFALPEVKGLIPNGRNDDGTLKNTEFTTNKVLTFTYTNNLAYTWIFQFDSAGISIVAASNYIESDNEPTNISGWSVWYNKKDNISYLKNIGAEGASWERQDLCNNQVKLTTDSSSKIISFTPKTAFHAADYNDVVLKQDLATIHCVVETYVNGTSWYRVYDDGWCEQGGEITIQAQRANTGLSTTVTFLKPYKDTNYYVSPITYITDGGNTAGLRNNHTDKNTTFMDISTWSTTAVNSSYIAAWYTSGYIS